MKHFFHDHIYLNDVESMGRGKSRSVTFQHVRQRARNQIIEIWTDGSNELTRAYLDEKLKTETNCSEVISSQDAKDTAAETIAAMISGYVSCSLSSSYTEAQGEPCSLFSLIAL